jgi:hypothetical protein
MFSLAVPFLLVFLPAPLAVHELVVNDRVLTF